MTGNAYLTTKLMPPPRRAHVVAQISVTGGTQRQIQVQMNLDALRARRLSPAQVTAAIAQANASLTGGRLQENGERLAS